jgi:hypothetical protein
MTALTDMAAAARPGTSEARVPCPRCGGLVHPVAGRCKHCKEDLTTLRAGRPQAATPLPALLGATPVPALIAAREESQPILPPRESAHGMPAQGTHSAWRRWPIVVIVLAGLAIVGAVVVMFWLPPSSGGSADSHGLKPPPAPERMELNPIPPPNSDPQPADPWGAPGAPQQAPRAPHAQRAPIAPDPLDPDPFANNNIDPFGGAPLGTGGNLDFVATFGRHLCDRLTQCGNSSDEVASYCNLMKAMPSPGAAPTCASAKKCLDHVDTMSCTLQGDDPAALSALVTQIPDCLDAITRC